ncbi:MAG: LysR family transcriptional regulator [Alphaproteobacteria bacterium]|nr:LysR family transcriptional regulator [Alphaproteobacteria bacterium]
MSTIYERDLDLNLLRVFLVVAETGSVTEAASVLYVTQPAVSAALKRLQSALDAELFAREGRGITLTARGRQLEQELRPHLDGILQTIRASGGFDPGSSERVVRLGLADSVDQWLLPSVVRRLGESAPGMSVIVRPVQFRTVAAALESGDVDLAVTVADDLPASVRREPLFRGGFVVLFDPRHHVVGETFDEDAYFAAHHAIVSYNGDRRGLVEDLGRGRRRVRVSLPSFHALGELVDDSPLLGTVPERVAASILALRPHLRTARMGLLDGEGTVSLLWRKAVDDDPALRFVRELLVEASGRQAA